MGSVSAAEILHLETYNEINFIEISRILNQWIDEKNVQTISTTNYFENIKNKGWVLFTWGFRSPGGGFWGPKNHKVGKIGIL